MIYLDSDLIIRDDIEDIWNTDVSEYFLAAVPDPYSDNHVALGFREDEKYFNAGVLVVNLAKWREVEVLPSSSPMLKKTKIFSPITINAPSMLSLGDKSYFFRFAGISQPEMLTCQHRRLG